jgi:phosphoenolpyruvate synthase/pyruvate phosphate dikinase
MKLRSSTNSEDLPDFNGAGLYDSYAYKPVKKASKKKGREKPEEKSQEGKRKALKETLRWLWSSIFNQRAWEERMAFGIPHDQVKMGVEVNPSFSNEELDGVVITKNVARNTEIKDPGVYIEAQRGDKHGVANPEAGVKPEQILVTIDSNDPLNASKYKIHRLQKSNIADDNSTIMQADNPKDVMLDAEVIDLVQLVKKAEAHFKPIMGKDKADFALDLEFKVDKEDSGRRQVYLKQARPYID